MQLDTNGDGKLSRDELPEGRMRDRFDEVDTNGDGAIDATEIADMVRQWRERGGPRRGGPGRGEPGTADDDRPPREMPQ